MSPPGLRSDVRGHSLSHIGILLYVESRECEQVVRTMNHLVLDLVLEGWVKACLCTHLAIRWIVLFCSSSRSWLAGK